MNKELLETRQIKKIKAKRRVRGFLVVVNIILIIYFLINITLKIISIFE